MIFINKKGLLLFIIICTISNCTTVGSKKEVLKYYKNGMPEEINYYKSLSDTKIIIEKVKFYKDGNISCVTKYKNNKKNGFEKSYDKFGNLIFEMKWKNGKLNGKSVFYYKSGKIFARGYFKDGILQYGKSYYENGTVMYEGNYLEEIYGYDTHGNIVLNIKNNKENFIDEKGNVLSDEIESEKYLQLKKIIQKIQITQNELMDNPVVVIYFDKNEKRKIKIMNAYNFLKMESVLLDKNNWATKIYRLRDNKLELIKPYEMLNKNIDPNFIFGYIDSDEYNKSDVRLKSYDIIYYSTFEPETQTEILDQIHYYIQKLTKK